MLVFNILTLLSEKGLITGHQISFKYIFIVVDKQWIHSIYYMNITVFWDVALCSLLEICWHF